MKSKIKIITRLLLILLLLIIVFKAALLYHFTTYREFYIHKLNQYLKSEVHEGLEIGNIKYEILGLSLGTEFTVQDISLTDSMFHSHQIKTIHIPKAVLRLKLLDILYRKITIKEIRISDASFNLFHLKNLYSNEYLFENNHVKEVSNPEKKIKRSKLMASLDVLSISHSNIMIDQRDIGKKFEFQLNHVSLYPNIISKNMHIQSELDVIFKNLIFSEPNGSFLKNAHIVSSPMVNFADSFVSFKNTTFHINEIPYQVSAIFGLKSTQDTLDLRFSSNEVSYAETIRLLSPNLTSLLSKMNFKQNIIANATILGHFKDSDPKIKVHFELKDNPAQFPYLDLESLKMKGYFTNKYDTSKAISDENSAVIIENMEGKNNYTEIKTSAIAITNMLHPVLKTSLELQGDVRGLKAFLPKENMILESGTYQIKGIFDNDLDINLQKLLDIKGDFKFNNIKAWIPKYNYWVQDFNCDVKYRNKKLQVDVLKFNVINPKEKSKKLEYFSSHSIFDFKDKFKLFSQFKAIAHPEVFSQFTKKHQFQPKNGTIEFKGTFDDILFFDLDHVPNIEGVLKIKEVDFYPEKYPVRLLGTNAEIKIKGAHAEVENLSARVYSIKDTHNLKPLQIYSDKTTVELATKPLIHSHFKLVADLRSFNEFLKDHSIDVKKGQVLIDGHFDGKIEGLYENLDKIKANIRLNDATIFLKPIQVLLEKINTNIALNQWVIDISNFQAFNRMYKVNITLKSDDLLKYWLGLKKSNHTDITIQAPALSLNTIEDITKKIPKSQNLKTPDQAIRRATYFLKELKSYDSFTGTVNIQLGYLNYSKYLLKNFDMKVLKTQEKTVLNRLNFNIGEGSASISGELVQTKDINNIYSHLSFRDISLLYLKNKFPEYLPVEYRKIALEGSLDVHSQMNMNVNMKDQLIEKSLFATSKIALRNVSMGNLNEFIPLKPKWLYKKWFNTIKFMPLELQVNTHEDSSYFEKTNIQTNIAHLWMQGHANTKGNYTIDLYFPYYNLTNFLFNKNVSKDSFGTIKNYYKIQLKK